MHRVTVTVCLFLLACTAVQARHEKYEGHLLYRVTGSSDQIAKLDGKLDILAATPAQRSEAKKLGALVRLSPEEKSKWLPFFEAQQMDYKLVSNNLAQILRSDDIEVAKTRNAADRSSTISWDAYYNAETINKYLDEVGAKHSDIVTVVDAGLTYEGRQIKYVKISTTKFEDQSKPVIVIDAGLHAREWVAPPVALYVIQQLVERVENDLTDLIDWIIIPMANPDGYEYSINEDRLWRKTRSKSHEGADECPGVDVDRNFNYNWGTLPNNANPCSPTYEGPSVFSEPEARVIRDAILPQVDRTALYISLHSYGSMILYSWGNGTIPSNVVDLRLTGMSMAMTIDRLKISNAWSYIVGNAAHALYQTTGTSRDWTRLAGVPLTYTFELPGYDYNLLVPPTYIKQIVTETWAGFVAGCRRILSFRK